jgi:cytochrome c oxidase subunit 5b
MMPVKRIANSTPENPNLLPSCNDKRLMACICKFIATYSNQLFSVFLGNEDVYHLKWMHLHRGEPKRCYCGMNDFLSLSLPYLQFSISRSLV